MKDLKVIAITHRRIDLSKIGKFHLEEEEQPAFLPDFKERSGFGEFMYLSTCNRVEFIFTSEEHLDNSYILQFLKSFAPSLPEEDIKEVSKNAEYHQGEGALVHLFNVASSLDSMVVGEREIITQVRNAFERCRDLGLTGETIRLTIDHTIRTAKKVYSQTDIARKPVSIVSLAYKKLRDLDIQADSRVLITGAGKTIKSMVRFLKKHDFSDITVFNRTLEKAESLASEVGGSAYSLEQLPDHSKGFDVLISCTGSSNAIITPKLYHQLLQGEQQQKILVDLAIPGDIDPSVIQQNPTHFVGIEELRPIAEKNIRDREKELECCRKIVENEVDEFKNTYKEREVELAMKEVPQKVKEIRQSVMENICRKDIEELDEDSKDVLEKVIDQMERKYISVPMKMAKEIMLNGENGNGKSRTP